MNSTIETIFEDFKVDGKSIPIAFMKYEGHEDTYITYQSIYENPLYSYDDEIEYSEIHYDIDIHSKGNYLKIIDEVKKKMKENEFVWCGDSEDYYNDDNGYYQKTIEFMKERKIN